MKVYLVYEIYNPVPEIFFNRSNVRGYRKRGERMNHLGLYSHRYKGQLVDDDCWVIGYLSILSIPFGEIGVGHYISVMKGNPFYHKVKRESVQLFEE